jgi:hypothetical protein
MRLPNKYKDQQRLKFSFGRLRHCDGASAKAIGTMLTGLLVVSWCRIYNIDANDQTAVGDAQRAMNKMDELREALDSI